MAQMNLYDLLGVPREAEIEQIKSAYRRLAKKLHPDVNAGDERAADRFKDITAAYNILADRQRREEYDREMMRMERPEGAEPRPWETDGAFFDFELDEATGERIADLYGDVAGTRMGRVKGAAATSMWMKGQDVAADVKVTETEAREGTTKLVTTMTGLTVAVEVPEGARHGQIVTLPGFGIEGFGGGPPGDLNVLVSVMPDPAIAGPNRPA
jgi:DnaJ-class molecular chaperone